MTYKILSLALIAALSVISCNSNDEETAPVVEETENIAASAIMTQSLERMSSQNDSLVIHHTGHMFTHHDSIYHHHDSVYVHYHNTYHHGDTIHHHTDGQHNETHHHQHDSINAAHHHIAH